MPPLPYLLPKEDPDEPYLPVPPTVSVALLAVYLPDVPAVPEDVLAPYDGVPDNPYLLEVVLPRPLVPPYLLGVVVLLYLLVLVLPGVVVAPYLPVEALVPPYLSRALLPVKLLVSRRGLALAPLPQPAPRPKELLLRASRLLPELVAEVP